MTALSPSPGGPPPALYAPAARTTPPGPAPRAAADGAWCTATLSTVRTCTWLFSSAPAMASTSGTWPPPSQPPGPASAAAAAAVAPAEASAPSPGRSRRSRSPEGLPAGTRQESGASPWR